MKLQIFGKNITLKFIIFAIICINVESVSVKPKLPKFLHICHRSDPNLNACVQETIEQLRPRLDKGIPELFIPPIEPLEIPEIKVNQDTGPVYVHSVYRNIVVHGLSRFNVKDVKIDTTKDKLKLKLWFPNIYITSNYTITGKIMMMTLQGEGGCRGNFSDVDVVSYMKGEKYTKNDVTHFKIKNISIKYTIGDSKIHLDNLFNGDETLGTTMNTFLNDNWKSVASEIQPVVQDAMSQMLHKTSGKLFDTFSLDQLMPN